MGVIEIGEHKIHDNYIKMPHHISDHAMEAEEECREVFAG